MTSLSNQWVWTIYGAVAICLGLVLWRQLKKMGRSPIHRASVKTSEPLRVEKNASGLQSEILKEGTGRGAKNLDTLTVEYICKLSTGEKLDSSYDRGKPMTFKLGTGAVIPGWDKSLKGIKVGEKRIVTVPASLAYGATGGKSVPPNSVLVFDIELVGLK